MTDAKIFFEGWGASSWSDQQWSQVRFLTGNMPAVMGNPTTHIDVWINNLGVEATLSVGTVVVIEGTGNAVFVTGEQANTAMNGDVTFVTNQNLSVTGVEGPTSVGTVTILLSQSIAVDGFELTTAVGDVENVIGADVDVTGVSAQVILGGPYYIHVWVPVPTGTNPWTPVNTQGI